MTNEDRFYKELSQVPELPSEIYSKVERRVIRRSFMKRSFLALAASIILVFGYLGYTVNNSQEKVLDNMARRGVLQPEVADELQNVSDYLNGKDLEREFDTYALINGY